MLTQAQDCDNMLHIIIWGMFNRPLALVLLAIYIFYAIFTLIMSIVQVPRP